MANNELLIANLDPLDDPEKLQVYLQSADGTKKTPPTPIGPQSFVAINTSQVASQVGQPPWTLGINDIPPQSSDTILHLPAVVNIRLRNLTAILYPFTASK